MESRFGLSRLIEKASLVGAFLLPAFLPLPAWADCPAPPATPLAKVVNVVDGDTLRLVDGRSVRLIGLNTPELAGKGRTDEPGAVAARRRLQALVEQAGGAVAVVPGRQPRDHYGRTLANVYTPDGRNLEARLLEEGLGYQVVVLPNDALSECHARAEQRAREAGIGVWRAFSPRPAASVDRSGFAVVAGRVLSVQRNRGGVWMNLDGGLVLHVAKANEESFDLGALQAMRGQPVEARGWVTDRGRRSGEAANRARWVLRLTAPAMLQALSSAPKVVGANP